MPQMTMPVTTLRISVLTDDNSINDYADLNGAQLTVTQAFHWDLLSAAEMVAVAEAAGLDDDDECVIMSQIMMSSKPHSGDLDENISALRFRRSTTSGYLVRGRASDPYRYPWQHRCRR